MRLRALTRVGTFALLVFLLGSGLYTASSASSRKGSPSPAATTATTGAAARVEALAPRVLPSLPAYASLLMPQAGPVSLETYAGDCTTPKTVFNLQDSDKTVCAKVSGALTFWRVIWSDSRSVAVQSNPLTSGTQDVTFDLTPTSNVGDWRVILFDPFGGTVQRVANFTVVDVANPVADVAVVSSSSSPEVNAGSQAVFTLQVTNYGPSPASNVTLTHPTPGQTSFVSFTQLDGPVFDCSSPAPSGAGDTVCTVASLGRGVTATFLATYQVDSGVSDGDVIAESASVTSDTTDNNVLNNASDSFAHAVASPCLVSCPSNITVGADAGQAGAVVAYDAPSASGGCGQGAVGEDGQPVPTVSCSNPSGSFFPVGTTNVFCVSPNGTACTFLVTVENPGGLSISLNGGSTVAVECGEDFNDPGASAINASGQSVPVTVTLPPGFDPGDPDVGSYTITYTATEDVNSVSTTRTVDVADTTAPQITLQGANPYKIEVGTCRPFVDPGASAADSCAGSVAVTRSISGPGGLTSVDPNTAGTYTITYTATDGSHPATTTRTVLVGNFPPDEVEDTGTPVSPPAIALLGGDPNNHAMVVECGSAFNDPGATAVNSCGAAIPYTTSGTVDTHTPGTYEITYTATDSGLSAEVTRAVTVQDTAAPVITVNGANPLTVECHSAFNDPGATAHDACAGNFAATASGSVDANTVGTYTITYNAADPGGHAATPVTRTVNVVDTTPPSISCPADLTVVYNPAISGTVVNYTTPAGADSCSGPLVATQTTGLPSGSTFPLGTTTNTFQVTDGAGHTASCSFKVTVALVSIVGLDSVSITGAGPVDSYDSGVGYPASKGSAADVLSNGTITMTGSAKVFGNVRSTRAGVAMSGSSQVTGNATAGTTVSRTGSASVGGVITNNALVPSLSLPAVTACGPPYSSNSGISGSYSYNASTGDLSLTGVNSATLANGTYCFHNLTLSNSGQLNVNGPVTIRLTGTLNVGGAAKLNNTTLIPSNLVILSSYGGSNGVSFTNSGNAYLLIYAPNTGVTISGAAPLFGTALGKSITISNSGTLHYDTRLQSIWPSVWPLIVGP